MPADALKSFRPLLGGGSGCTNGVVMSQQELLAIARRGRPNVRYAASRDGAAIGAWVQEKGRFVMVASKLISGGWASVPFEILANGKPPYGCGDWLE